MTIEEPTQIKMKAIDVVPHKYGQWCSIGDGKPFVNPFCHRQWSDDGETIWFMLESHNFYDAKPDDEMLVVEVKLSEWGVKEWDRLMRDDAVEMARRPSPPEDCPHCGQRMPQKFRTPEAL